MGTTSVVYVVAATLSVVAVALGFMLALARSAAHADRSTEQLLSESLERVTAVDALAARPIEARRIQAGEPDGTVSRRRTWRQPSSV